MALTPRRARSALALTILVGWAASARAEHAATFQASVADLANSYRPSYDPAFLAGIGQIYCHMKVVVGDDEPLRPDTVLAVLHQKHPDTQPKSRSARDAQRRAMLLAGTLLCPSPQSSTASVPPAN